MILRRIRFGRSSFSFSSINVVGFMSVINFIHGGSALNVLLEGNYFCLFSTMDESQRYVLIYSPRFCGRAKEELKN